MFSWLSTCLLIGGAFASSALAHHIKIISPKPGSQIQAGCTLNVTLQIDPVPIDNFQQLLGFGLNSDIAAQPKALGELFLGLFNNSKTPFDPSTRQLSWSLDIPSPDNFTKGIKPSYSLVVSQYIISGTLNTPHCGVVSVPVVVIAANGKCSDIPSLPASETPKGSDCNGQPCPTTPIVSSSGGAGSPGVPASKPDCDGKPCPTTPTVSSGSNTGGPEIPPSSDGKGSTPAPKQSPPAVPSGPSQNSSTSGSKAPGNPGADSPKSGSSGSTGTKVHASAPPASPGAPSPTTGGDAPLSPPNASALSTATPHLSTPAPAGSTPTPSNETSSASTLDYAARATILTFTIIASSALLV